MFKKQATEPLRPELEKAINDALRELDGFTAEGPEYERVVNQLTKLYELRNSHKEKTKSISPEAWLTAGTSILTVGMIIYHERAAVITSKALGFVMKTKL